MKFKIFFLTIICTDFFSDGGSMIKQTNKQRLSYVGGKKKQQLGRLLGFMP